MKSKLKRIGKILGIVLLIAFVIAQFFRIDKTNPTVDYTKDFVTIENPPKQIATMIKNACYDCHSFESKYPWYTNIAPVSWIVRDHIDEGRDELNFSEWTSYIASDKKELLEDSVEEIEEGEMPLWDYLLMHPEAKLSEIEKKELMAWLKSR